MRNSPKRDWPRCFVIRLWALTTALAILAVPASAWTQDAETRIALVIGNGYKGELKNPPNDARLMATTLRGLGFTLVGGQEGQPMIDADQKAMKLAIQTFGEALDRAGPSAVGLFYYAGHGVQASGRNYLIPIGANIRREADLEIEAVTADSVLAQMEYSRSGVNLMILDACRDNPYQRRLRSMSRGLAQMGAPNGSLIAYATAPGSVAEDGPGANSPYTAALVEAIAIPSLAVEQVFKRVRITVKEATGGRQVPWDASSLTGEFSFRPVVAAIPSPATTPLTIVTEQSKWDEAARTDTADAYRSYLEVYPQGAHAAEAQATLGRMYEQGRGGLPKDDRQAVQWYRKAAEQGHAGAQNNLGWMYEQGRGGLPNDDRQAVQWFRKAAEQGHAGAQDILGLMYETGRGVAQDETQAVQWYRKAAEQGDAIAQNALGHMYEQGRGGLPKDDRQAVQWHRKAAEQGHVGSQDILGWMYETGRGVAQDETQAVQWYRKAADQGDTTAQNALGQMYEQGRGGLPKDDRQAVQWYRKAADQGNISAQYNLRVMCARGVRQACS